MDFRHPGRGTMSAASRVPSLAILMVLQHRERTLEEAEIAKAVDRVSKMLAHRFDGVLR